MESVRVQICYFPFVWVNYLFTILVLKIWDKNICSIFGGLYIIIYFREKYFYVKSMEKEIEEFKEVAGYLWDRGWAEKNAGNISVRLPDDTILVSASGSKMKNIKNNFETNALKIRDNGDNLEFIQFTEKECMPTSELITHLSLHTYFQNNNLKHKAIIHTHPDEIIALTQNKKFKSSSEINKLIWNILPESKLALPAGIEFVKYYTSGSKKLAMKTLSAAVKSNLIIWEKHGCIAFAETLEEAFDLIDVFVKAIKIYFMIRSAKI